MPYLSPMVRIVVDLAWSRPRRSEEKRIAANWFANALANHSGNGHTSLLVENTLYLLWEWRGSFLISFLRQLGDRTISNVHHRWATARRPLCWRWQHPKRGTIWNWMITWRRWITIRWTNCPRHNWCNGWGPRASPLKDWKMSWFSVGKSTKNWNWSRIGIGNDCVVSTVCWRFDILLLQSVIVVQINHIGRGINVFWYWSWYKRVWQRGSSQF